MVLKCEKPLSWINNNKKKKQQQKTVYKIFLILIYFSNWSFVSLKCWDRLMSGMKHMISKKNQIRSDTIVPVHFRAQHQAEYSSLQLMANCSAAKSCLSTLYQTDLRIGNHRRHKSPPSLTLLSFYTQIKWPYLLTTTEAFRAYFKLLCLR